STCVMRSTWPTRWSCSPRARSCCAVRPPTCARSSASACSLPFTARRSDRDASRESRRLGADGTVGRVHPRISVSAISTYTWGLDRDIEFWAAAGVTNVGVSLAKLNAYGVEKGLRRLLDAGAHVGNVLGTGTSGLAAGIDVASHLSADCLVFTTGRAAPRSWEDAADALATTLAPLISQAAERDVPLALEHTNSLRADVGFVHTLRDAIDLARGLDIGVCMEINACWGERA